mmetsp:Transcript_11306/g.38251  ORF Transcript_11306/g.38251 Transcript_11306/m.38251 type:complete len:216 (-) Transcript_11306:169-816(-)
MAYAASVSVLVARRSSDRSGASKPVICSSSAMVPALRMAVSWSPSTCSAGCARSASPRASLPRRPISLLVRSRCSRCVLRARPSARATAPSVPMPLKTPILSTRSRDPAPRASAMYSAPSALRRLPSSTSTSSESASGRACASSSAAVGPIWLCMRLSARSEAWPRSAAATCSTAPSPSRMNARTSASSAVQDATPSIRARTPRCFTSWLPSRSR